MVKKKGPKRAGKFRKIVGGCMVGLVDGWK
jgi:hypothetical protein